MNKPAKVQITLFTLLFISMSVWQMGIAQTLRVHQGNVAIAHNVTVDDIPFHNGTTLSIGTATYNIANIDSICGSTEIVDDNSVLITYSGNSAQVTISANVAPMLTTTINGAHVSIVQSSHLANEITYTLQGTSSNGSFWMDGNLKASLVLNNLSLTCADSAAINIRDSKRISVTLADGTTNTLADGSAGSQKACFMVKGHTEFRGAGSLTLTGHAAHGFWGGEYVEFKKSLGSITIASAVKDGFNVNQYLEVKGGTLQINAVGDDGIQVSKTDDESDEQNGQVLISGGTLNISVSANAAKGIKCDDNFTMSNGTLNITTTGGGMYDSATNDVSASAAIKVGGNTTIDGGNITLNSTGAGGKGLNCSNIVTINNGTISVSTTGKQYSYNRQTSSAKGIRAEGNLYINGGDVSVTCSGGEGSEGLESKHEIHITAGDITSNCYDDAINAATKIDISGGRIYAYASNNDGIDSNGTLYISGGVVLANGTNQPEEGFDCDQNTFSVTGGTLIGIGGSTSTPTSTATTQPVLILGGLSFTQNTYLCLSDADGNKVWTYRIPRSINQATLLISSPSLKQGSSCTLTTGVSVAEATEWNGYATDGTASGGSTLATSQLTSIVTSSGSSSGVPGGGGQPGGGLPGGGGGRPGGRW